MKGINANMFSQSIKLGRVFGIPIGMNYSWLIIFFLITVSLSAYFAQLHADWTTETTVLFGIVTSILFFASVFIHEIGHALMGRRFGVPVKSITLFVFGGVAQITKEPEKPAHEFAIGVIGPVVSAALGGIFYALMFAVQGTSEGLTALAQWLGKINLLLAAFNLIPGFPLDGGRVLRAVVWYFVKSYERATRIAAGAGQVFAYLFIFYGVWLVFSGNFIGGLWIGFIGWFLLSAAQSTITQTALRHSLVGIAARDVMVANCTSLPPSATVAEFVEQYVLRSGTHCTVVTDNGHIQGLVTVHEVKKIPRDEWAMTPLQAVMVLEEQVEEVQPETPVNDVLQKMSETDISQMPVIKDGHFVGVINRDRLLALVQTRLELKT